jgi:phage terminase large subunit-like protein
MDMPRFLKCADPKLSLSEFTGKDCVIGLDLAAKLDLSAEMKIFWRRIDSKTHWYAFGDYWTPEARIKTSPVSQYQAWADEGRFHVSDGEENDFDEIENSIRQDCRTYQVRSIAHDAAQAVEVIQHLNRERMPVFEVPQRAQYLSPAMRELEAAVYSGRFHYNGDPVLAWAMSCVVCHPDKNDNLFPNKSNPKVNKIDPVTALLTGMYKAMELADLQPDAPKRNEILIFELED